ncbi:hypothetical protein IFM89_006767 [Coptis chinensis]|uniref:Uncharacterized protein n=1 Tax=Coptis chinensis TaxID=261450 RepID=A0A835LYR6_9MAGN|nr:hypothetical protein IFM89_006767 [Coptis chinensis]
MRLSRFAHSNWNSGSTISLKPMHYLLSARHIAAECSTKSLCWNCCEPDHMGSDLQNEVICHTFSKAGHITRDSAADLKVCNNCYKTSHIDLLGCAGHLEEALNLVAMIPIEACGEHSLLLIGSTEILIREKGVRKNPGCSLMEVKDGIIHELFAGDITHPKSKEMKEALDDLLQTSFGLFSTKLRNYYVPTWAFDHIKYFNGGNEIQLLVDKYTINDVQLSPQNSKHDELDFVFLGNEDRTAPTFYRSNVFTEEREIPDVVYLRKVSQYSLEGVVVEDLGQDGKEQGNGMANFDCNGVPLCKGEVTEADITPIYGRGNSEKESGREGKEVDSSL